MCLEKAAFLRPFALFKQLPPCTAHQRFQPLRITILNLLLVGTAKIYFLHRCGDLCLFVYIIPCLLLICNGIVFYFVTFKRRTMIEEDAIIRSLYGVSYIAFNSSRIFSFVLPTSPNCLISTFSFFIRWTNLSPASKIHSNHRPKE